ncbi:MAG: cyclic nucleotide-binding domain-containing protein [Burkholderiales bacterium]|nr:cyclic nucleotide-binding domain-containing protein [Burkholderiales bacterium]MCW5576083.1 cyclic nucleotide-binding domain-containing protein [Burkholderiales bacterium]MCW5604134.1 cyclic nucleotide-binding domain-containing protein [Burkholderiales bacterium]
MDIKQFLKTLPAFESFTGAHVDALAGLMAVSSHPADHRLITQGAQGDAMYLLMEGAIRTSRIHEVTGELDEARDLHAGEIFGLLSLIENMPAGWTSVAKEAVTVAALSRPDFLKLYELAPPVAHHLQYMVAVQLARELQARNKELRELLKKRATATPA